MNGRLPSAPVDVPNAKSPYFRGSHRNAELPLLDRPLGTGPGEASDGGEDRFDLHEALSQPGAWNRNIRSSSDWHQIVGIGRQRRSSEDELTNRRLFRKKKDSRTFQQLTPRVAERRLHFEQVQSFDVAFQREVPADLFNGRGLVNVGVGHH